MIEAPNLVYFLWSGSKLNSYIYAMKITAGELAKMVNGSLEGDPDMTITHPAKIEEGTVGSVSFLANPKYESYLYSTEASMVVVGRNFIPKKPVRAALLRVDNVYLAVSKLLNTFESYESKRTGIDPTAAIDTNVTIGTNVFIGPHCIIEAGCEIGDGVVIDGQVYLASNVKISNNTRLYPGVKVYKDCKIGADCIIHSNVVIGSDGFGFSPDGNGVYKKVSQIGNVIIGNRVEIGSNTTIDRATLGSTVIGDGCKLDNLIMIAHNVQIGENTVIAAQVGIAGSTKIGKNCMVGGQVGIAGHLTIADGTVLQAQTGVASSLLKENGKWYGSPAIEYFSYLRSYAEFKKLPELAKKIKQIERIVKKYNKANYEPEDNSERS